MKGPYTSGDHIRLKLEDATTAIDYGIGYIEFTISAERGYRLNLTSLDFDSARGGDTGTRGFEIYGVVGDRPQPSDLLMDVNDESGTRDTPTRRSINLSAPQYQGI